MDKTPPYLIATESGALAIAIEANDTPHMKLIKEFMALYGIIDIKMRMLFVAELLKIQGFPDDYVLEGTQADKKKFIGNSVEVNQARVILQASVNANIFSTIKSNNP
jgi:DNA (cytosine-5)-methyltransferase 1